MRRAHVLAVTSVLLVHLEVRGQSEAEAPRVHDSRLEAKLFAAAPDIVHPISLDFDSKGRLLVIESHTHFAPPGYKGPKHDRVRVLEDTDGDGRADRIGTFFDGIKHAMDLAVHPDGSVYLATRNEILRLGASGRDKQRIMFLDTKGDYPHNGLSGLCFDSRGNLHFGMGENLGASFKLIGSDGTTMTGEGDGGHIFACTADGRKLRRVATGFWNPFGICRDIYGRMFAVDNDPDATPPCRLVHVVQGGDYGFQFRYGRSGRHPFQAWNGELPGTLPMICGTGEAPCEVLSYESDGLPAEYLGNLLVTAWADHRVERYVLKEKGASFSAEREPFVQGGKDFRPVGLAVAPDGSLFVSDWVLKDYTLHGRGAIWHIRAKNARKVDRPEDPRKAVFSLHRPLREAAARKLAENAFGQSILHKHASDAEADNRLRAACLASVLETGSTSFGSWFITGEQDVGIRLMATRALAERAQTDLGLLQAKHLALKLEALTSMSAMPPSGYVEMLTDSDPFIRHAAVHLLARTPTILKRAASEAHGDPRARLGVLLAYRASGLKEGRALLPRFLTDRDEEVCFLAAKWIADEKLMEHRPLVVDALTRTTLSPRMYLAYSTALARLDGKEVNEAKLADYFLERFAAPDSPAGARVMALQLVPAKHPRLKLSFLAELLAHENAALQLEAVRALGEHPDPKRGELLLNVLRDGKRNQEVRAQAVVGLADRAHEFLADLLASPLREGGAPREEVLRAIVQTKLTSEQRRQLEDLARKQAHLQDLVARVLDRPFFQDRPPAKDIDGWLKRLAGTASPSAGRRIFAHPRLGTCARCHRVEGRGSDVGPDLSTIGRSERRHILESILQPSNHVAPHYQAWLVETQDGKTRTGMLMRTHLDEYTYLDEKGGQFKVNTRDVTTLRALPNSIMPDGLVDQLTDQEIRDLLSYLTSRR
jgi:putative membrane-bound dehydrogenase-like protein